MQQHTIKIWLFSFLLVTTLFLSGIVMMGFAQADNEFDNKELSVVLEENEHHFSVILNVNSGLQLAFYLMCIIALINFSHIGHLNTYRARIRGSPVIS